MSVDTSTSVASGFGDAPPATHAASPVTSTDEWGRFWRFLKNPRLPERSRPFGLGSIKSLLRLLLLDLSIMVILIALAGLVVSTGFEMPKNELNDLELGAGIVAAIVLGAPIMEEVLFRGWLSGKIGHIIAVLIGLGAFAGITLNTGAPPLIAAFFIGGTVAAAIILFMTRKRAPMRWFARAFPAFFWLSTLSFALVHLVNYTEGSLLMLLPLVIPQFVAGSIFGYARVTHGLWASILLHALHNGTAVGMVLLGTQLAGS